MNYVLRKSSNYDMFELHEVNRDIGKTKSLEKSMKTHGFIAAIPLHVVKNGGKKLKIKDGHHRFFVARRLGLPVWYVISDDDASIWDLNENVHKWTPKDYLASYVRYGLENYHTVKQFQENTGLSLGICVSLLAGETAGSSNRTRQFNSGNFRLADDLSHAYAIAEVVDILKEAGIKWGTNSYLVQAISRCLWVDEFDIEVFKTKIKRFTFLFEKQATMRDYAGIVEKVYNRGTQNKIPLAFLAEQKARERVPIKKAQENA